MITLLSICTTDGDELANGETGAVPSAGDNVAICDGGERTDWTVVGVDWQMQISPTSRPRWVAVVHVVPQ